MHSTRRLILIGAGHAHLHTISRLEQLTRIGHSVTIVSPRSYYYSGMIPGLIDGRYTPDEVQIDIGPFVSAAGAEFVPERVTRINAEACTVETETGTRVPYDVLSIDVGSTVNTTGIRLEECDFLAERVFPVKPLANVLRARKAVETVCRTGRIRCAVIGGGATGVELAANAACIHGNAGVTLFAGGGLLGRFSPRFRLHAKRLLHRRGVSLQEGSRVVRIADGALELEDGARVPVDMVLIATGTRPVPIALDSDISTTPAGAVVVDQHLRSVNRLNVFAGGDCAHFLPRPLPPAGVYAIRQAPVLYRNLLHSLAHEAADASPCEAFVPQHTYLQILSMGAGYGIAQKGSMVVGGRTVLWLKEYLDRTFMRKVRRSLRVRSSSAVVPH